MLSFRTAAVALAAAAAALSALPSDGAKEPRGRNNEPPRPVAPPLGEPTVKPLPRGTEPPNPSAGAGKRDRALRIARRFLRAFLRYQAGHLDDTARRALSATATPELASTLLRRPPRPIPSRPRSARLRRLAVIGPFARRLKVVGQLTYPNAGAHLLELALERRGGRLRVTHLYP